MMLPLVVTMLAAAGPPDVSAPSVAVFRLEAKHGVPAGAADLLTETLLAEVRSSGAFSRVVSPSEIGALMRPEQQEFLLRCASDECAVVDNELAGALGVSHIIVGNLGKLGTSYLLNLRLLDVRSSVLVSSLAERTRGSTEEALLDLVRPSTRRLLVDGTLLPEAPAPRARAETRPLFRRLLWLGAAVLFPAAALAGAAASAGWSVSLAASAVDVGLGWRPGRPHQLTATQGALANVAAVLGWLAAAAALATCGLGALALAVSGVVS